MKDIEQYLRDNAPETPSEGQFLIETNARLNAVEGIKKTVDGERRNGRIALIVALAAGLVLGCLRRTAPPSPGSWRPCRTSANSCSAASPCWPSHSASYPCAKKKKCYETLPAFVPGRAGNQTDYKLIITRR